MRLFSEQLLRAVCIGVDSKWLLMPFPTILPQELLALGQSQVWAASEAMWSVREEGRDANQVIDVC